MDALMQDSLILVLSESLQHEETVSRPGPGPIDPLAAHLKDGKDTVAELRHTQVLNSLSSRLCCGHDKQEQIKAKVHIIRLLFLLAFVIDNSLQNLNLSLCIKQSRDNTILKSVGQNLHLDTFNWLITIYVYFCFAILMRPKWFMPKAEELRPSYFIV